MRKNLFNFLLTFCVSILAFSVQAQYNHKTDLTNFPVNPSYANVHHFDAISLGDAGGLFIGGLGGERGISWNAYQDDVGTWKFLNGSNHACKTSYTHWNKRFLIEFSDNSPSYNTAVNYKTMLSIQMDPDPEMKFCGKFFANHIVIDNNISWCDYVFASDYKLMPINKLEQFINTYKHLPEVPSAQEVADNGIEVTDMLKTHMKKIEELTLYIIDQNKRIESLEEELSSLKSEK